MSQNSDFVKNIYALSEQVGKFTNTEQGYSELAKHFQSLVTRLGNDSTATGQSFKDHMATMAKKSDTINQLFERNTTLNQQVQSIADNSINQSDSYILSLSKQLADPVARSQVSTFERQIIAAALVHTTSTYNIKLIFQRLKHDPNAASELMRNLDELDKASEAALEQLKGSPMLEKAQQANKANLDIRRLSKEYIANIGQIQSLNKDINQTLAAMLAKVNSQSDKRIKGVFDSISASLLQILLGITVVVVLTIAMSVVFATSIASPLKELGRLINQLASKGGDLTFRIPLKRSDEIGQLATGVNRFLETLQDIFKGVADNGRQIADSAKEAAKLSQVSVQQMDRQQKETSSVATAFNEMEASIQEIANNASDAADKVQQADNSANEVVSIISTTIDNVNNLGRELELATSVIGQLNQDSQDIGGILDVIRAIAEQTNLLALNAAIEAARAGEQGRGFAVVADEVRSLAQRTQSSIEEIHGMISKLQTASQRATDVIVKGNEQIGVTTENSQVAGGGVQNISGLVSAIASMNIQVASAVEEQSAVVQEINRSIQQIQQLSEQSSHSAKASSSSADDQAVAAEHLLELIGKFKV
ncbi:methyl-accepting chemotaxis protein [Gallaecimonas mangrovi]|uniref:methyl-accepting chemotaxis protein n=1 Tax=Gallaecimonas mangrovi TaxID=2291597 RepID=UPI0018663002|nr:methyl-accepting chemotaxis protein [Gallaecimonas mangrovi]